jgi:hypothetical protein
MQDPSNGQSGQLPTVAANSSNGAIAPNVPSAALPLATGVGQAEGVIQQALTVLMNTNLSPYQMALNYIALKEDYLAKTYGVTIE